MRGVPKVPDPSLAHSQLFFKLFGKLTGEFYFYARNQFLKLNGRLSGGYTNLNPGADRVPVSLATYSCIRTERRWL